MACVYGGLSREKLSAILVRVNVVLVPFGCGLEIVSS